MAADSRTRIAFLGVCVVALLAVTGCGGSGSSSRDAASDGSAPTTSVKIPSNTADPSHAEIKTSWTMMFVQGAKSEPTQSLYAVFRREQTGDEAKIAPEVVADFSCSMPLPARSKHVDLGKPIAEKARILLRGVGSGDDTLVAAPTTADSVAVAVFPSGSGTCTRPAENGLVIAGDNDGNLYGMVDDHVRSVDVIAEGKTHHAKLGENGFWVTLPSGAEEHLDKLVLHKADGSKTELPLG